MNNEFAIDERLNEILLWTQKSVGFNGWPILRNMLEGVSAKPAGAWGSMNQK